MKLTKIITYQYQKNNLISLSKKVAEESGTAWVDMETIQAHNDSLPTCTVSFIRRLTYLCTVEKPYILGLVSIGLPTLTVFLLTGLRNWMTGVIYAAFVAIFGLILFSLVLCGDVYSGCKICNMTRKSSKCIFSHVLSYKEHTERRRNNNTGAILKVLVRDELVFEVLECKKCHTRKIEIVQRTGEKLL